MSKYFSVEKFIKGEEQVISFEEPQEFFKFIAYISENIYLFPHIRRRFKEIIQIEGNVWKNRIKSYNRQFCLRICPNDWGYSAKSYYMDEEANNYEIVKFNGFKKSNIRRK